MKSSRLLAPLVLGMLVLAGCSDGANSPRFTAQLVGLIMDTTGDTSVPAGRSLQLTAIGEFTLPPGSNPATESKSASAEFAVDNTAVARIEGNMLVGVSPGTVNVRASRDGVTSAFAPFTVTDPVLERIVVTPVDPTIPSGTSRQFTAKGIYSNSTAEQDIVETVTWDSSESGVATVSPTTGTSTTASTPATGSGVQPNPNVTVIRARATNTEGELISGSSRLTVGPPVFVTLDSVLAPGNDTPSAPQVALGRTELFTAQGTRTDGSGGDIPNAELTWLSTATTIATIDANGVATTVSEGTTTVRATLNSNGQNAAVTLTVTPPVLEEISIVRSDAVPIPDSGIVCNGVPLPESVSLTVLGRYSNSGGAFESIRDETVTPIAWQEDVANAAVAVPTPTGASTSVNCVTPGQQETVSASTTSEEGILLPDSVLFDVVTPPLSPPAAMSVIEPSSATIDGKSTQPVVGPSGLGVGDSATYWARVVLEDGREYVVAHSALDWSSDQPGVATVDPDGVVKAIGPGTATIRATIKDGYADEISDPASRTVTAPVQVR